MVGPELNIRSHKAPLTLVVAAYAAGGADCRSKVRHLQGLNDDSAHRRGIAEKSNRGELNLC